MDNLIGSRERIRKFEGANNIMVCVKFLKVLWCVGCMACKFDGVKLLTLDVNRGQGV